MRRGRRKPKPSGSFHLTFPHLIMIQHFDNFQIKLYHDMTALPHQRLSLNVVNNWRILRSLIRLISNLTPTAKLLRRMRKTYAGIPKGILATSRSQTTLYHPIRFGKPHSVRNRRARCVERRHKILLLRLSLDRSMMWMNSSGFF